MPRMLSSEMTKQISEYFETCWLGDLAHYWNEVIGCQTGVTMQEEDIDDDTPTQYQG